MAMIPGHSPGTVAIHPLTGIGEITPQCDLAGLLADALVRGGLTLAQQDVLVVAQKAVSKSENRLVHLDKVVPSSRARALAAETEKDPQLVELILSESTEVVRHRPGLLIVRHRLGFVMAQAGIDRSNVPAGHALLLPEDPDHSAEQLRLAMADLSGVSPGVIITDSFGRPWRLGTTNVAIGAAGVPSIWDRRGELDRGGRQLEATVVAWADAVAAGAGLVMGEATEGVPAALVRGLHWTAPETPARAIVRAREEDMFA